MKQYNHFCRSIIKSLEKLQYHDVSVKKASFNTDRSYTVDTTFIEPSFINKRYDSEQYLVHIPFSNTNISAEINFRDQQKEHNDIIQLISEFLVLLALIMKNTFGKTIPDFVLIIYMSEEKKYLPKDFSKEVISAKHVNSGVTISYTNRDKPSQIIIYREEELLKVLTHEVLHLCETHFDRYNEVIDINIKEAQHITKDSTLNLFESYVETLTLIINTIIYSYIKSPNASTRLIKSNMAIEKDHSQRVVDELYYMLHSSPNSNKQKIFPLNEKTNTFSYLVIKLLFLQNEDIFFSTLDANYCVNQTNCEQFLQMIVNNLPKIKVNNLCLNQNNKKIKKKTLYPSLKFCKFDIYKTYLKMKTIRRDINKR